MVAVKEDAVVSLTNNVYQFFANQGAHQLLDLAQGENYVFIGVKDQERMTEKKGPGVGVGLMLSFSESVREVRQEFAATEGGSRIEFESAGFENGNWASITVENEQVLTREQATRGLNIVVLNGKDHKVIMRKTYDTSLDGNASKALVADAKKVPRGAVVIAVVKDDGAKLLDDKARKLFIKMGSEEIRNLKAKEGWGFVGVVGQKVFGEQMGAKVRAAMTLSFSKEVKEPVRKPAKVEGGSRFEVHSAGLFPHQAGNFAKIMLNNIVVPTCEDAEKGCRGLNVVAADAFTHKVLLAQAYDTYANAKESERFLNDVKAFPEGTIFMVGVRDEASTKMTEKVKKFFRKMGSSHVDQLGFRHSWAFIGVKG